MNFESKLTTISRALATSISTQMKMKSIIFASMLFASVATAAVPITSKQLQNPTELTEVTVSEGRTEILVASWKDLNAIHTPFKYPKIIKDTDIAISTDGSSVYFTPLENASPFGMFITDRDDKSAPKIKLNIIPTDLPVGQQIKLSLDDDTDWLLKKKKKTTMKSDKYTESILMTLEEIGRSYPKRPPAGYKMTDKVSTQPTFYGNTLMMHERRYRTSSFIVDAYSATNRSDEVVVLNASDFLAESNTDNPLIEDAANNAVAFYPLKELDSGQSTNVFILRAR